MIEERPRSGPDVRGAPRGAAASGVAGEVREERHAGKRITVVDLTGLGAGPLQAAVDRAVARIQQEPPGSVLLVTVVKDVRLGVGVSDLARAYSAAIRPQVKAAAVVGLSSFAKAIFLMVKPFLHHSTTAFPELDAAKAWLAAYR